jgi:type I restriction enzyme S subunit
MSEELPKGWRRARLGELGEWGSGGTPSKAKADFWENGQIPWLSPKDLKRPRIADSIDHVTPAGVAAARLRLLPAGSVVFVVRGLILARAFPVALTEVRVTINQDLRYVIATNDVLPAYLAWALRYNEHNVLSFVREATHGTLRIDSDTLRALPIPLPPLPQQQRIVEQIEMLLSRASTTQERLTRVEEVLRQFRHSVLAAACSGRLTGR